MSMNIPQMHATVEFEADIIIIRLFCILLNLFAVVNRAEISEDILAALVWLCRDVKVIRLVGRSTVEEIILRRAEHKLQLTHNVMSSATDNMAADDDNEDAPSMKVSHIYAVSVTEP